MKPVIESSVRIVSVLGRDNDAHKDAAPVAREVTFERGVWVPSPPISPVPGLRSVVGHGHGGHGTLERRTF